MKVFGLPTVCLATVLCACMPLESADTSPPVDMPDAFVHAKATPIGDLAAQAWWQGFHDDRLNALVERGLAQNLDIATAQARVRKAEADLRATGLNAQVQGNLTGQTVRAVDESYSDTASTSSAGSLSGSYVVDLFGGNASTRQEARATRDAAEFDVATARLTLLSSIIGRYIDARYDQNLLELTRQTIASREKTLHLVTEQATYGSASDLDTASAQADLDTARSSLPTLIGDFEASVFALATLLDEPAGPLMTSLQSGAPQPRPGAALNLGVPADLLRNRPDVRAAESRFIAATAAIGVAKADLYPALTLSGTITRQDASSWQFGPILSLPIFNYGRLTAKLQGARANAEVARLDWMKTILSAVEDVQKSQSAYVANHRQSASLAEAVASTDRVRLLSQTTYLQGSATLLDLLDAERRYTSARQSLAQSLRAEATSWAKLQIAIGRGAAEK
jgi:multidrug efflux system outer membrane protein